MSANLWHELTTPLVLSSRSLFSSIDAGRTRFWAPKTLAGKYPPSPPTKQRPAARPRFSPPAPSPTPPANFSHHPKPTSQPRPSHHAPHPPAPVFFLMVRRPPTSTLFLSTTRYHCDLTAPLVHPSRSPLSSLGARRPRFCARNPQAG